MKATPTAIPEVLVLEPQVFGDAHGFNYESLNARRFEQLTGASPDFVQNYHSRSARGVLRGLHYQVRQPQAKLIRVVVGAIYEVVLDLRRASPFFGRWVGVELSAENRRQLWIPPGFAHGYVVTSDVAECLHSATDYWAPEYERTIVWNDPALEIDWPLDRAPMLSERDAHGCLLAQAETFA